MTDDENIMTDELFNSLPSSVRLVEDTTKKEGETVLQYTQRLRTALVDELTGHGLPTDPKEVNVLLNILNSMDAQEMNSAKLDLASQEAKANEQSRAIIADIVKRVGNNNPYLAQEPIEREMKHSGAVIEGVELVEGELDMDRRQLNYNTFMKEYEENNPDEHD